MRSRCSDGPRSNSTRNIWYTRGWKEKTNWKNLGRERLPGVSFPLYFCSRGRRRRRRQILSALEFNRGARRGPRKVLERFDSRAHVSDDFVDFERTLPLSWPTTRRVSFFLSTANRSRSTRRKEEKTKGRKKDRGGPSNFHRREERALLPRL